LKPHGRFLPPDIWEEVHYDELVAVFDMPFEPYQPIPPLSTRELAVFPLKEWGGPQLDLLDTSYASLCGDNWGWS
jgi:hypothetical protein